MKAPVGEKEKAYYRTKLALSQTAAQLPIGTKASLVLQHEEV